MTYSQRCMDLVKGFESFCSSPYQDPAGNWTVGYGHLCPETQPAITEAEAEAILREDLTKVAEAVNRLLKVPVSQAEFDALCSFAFNVGPGNFERSTLRRLINEDKRRQASDEFLRWVFAGDLHLPGLKVRRMAERKLFLSGEEAA